MHLTQIDIANLRNLTSLSFAPASQFNVLYGENGSGKTSILEAIHLLSLGKSFRTHLLSSVIQRDANKCSVFGMLQPLEGSAISLGLERTPHGDSRLRINGQDATAVAELARHLPLLLIDSNVAHIITEGPEIRRQFLNWGVFHVEHSFFSLWKNFHSALKQRNAALRLKDGAQARAWNDPLINYGVQLTQQRENYLKVFFPIAQGLSEAFKDIYEFECKYSRGWHPNKSLEEVLVGNMERDLAMGYTTAGPHRFDMLLSISHSPVNQTLSHGQQKTLACILKLSQGVLLNQMANQRCVYLIDDLPAELDSAHNAKLLAILEELSAQVFVTSIELNPLTNLLTSKNCQVFHVEHGSISA